MDICNHNLVKINLNNINLCPEKSQHFINSLGSITFSGYNIEKIYSKSSPINKCINFNLDTNSNTNFIKLDNVRYQLTSIMIVPKIHLILNGNGDSNKDCVGELMIRCSGNNSQQVIICIPLKEMGFFPNKNNNETLLSMPKGTNLNIDKLIPQNQSYYLYKDNKCQIFDKNEQFIVFDTPINIKKHQIDKFREVLGINISKNIKSVNACKGSRLSEHMLNTNSHTKDIMEGFDNAEGENLVNFSSDNFEVQCDPYYIYDQNNEAEIWTKEKVKDKRSNSSTATGDTKMVKPYIITHAPKSSIGDKLPGSGVETWTDLDGAVKAAEKHGHKVGKTCRYIQNWANKVYFYKGGSVTKAGSDNNWRFDPNPEYKQDDSMSFIFSLLFALFIFILLFGISKLTYNKLVLSKVPIPETNPGE